MSSRSKSNGGSNKTGRPNPVEGGVVSESGKNNNGSDDVVAVEEMEKTIDGQTCKSCAKPDTDEMVQCDHCDGWHHYSCVGVTDDVANQSWSCTNCKTAKWIQRTTPTSKKQPTLKDAKTELKSRRTLSVQEGRTSARSSCGKSIHSEPPSVPVIQSNLRNDKRKEKLFVPSVEGVPIIELEKPLSEVSCSSSQRSARNRAKLQLLRLQEEREFEEKQAERRRQEQQEEAERRRITEQQEAEKHREFLDRKYNILETLASEKGSSRSSRSSVSRSRVEQWVETTNRSPVETVQRSTGPAALPPHALQVEAYQARIQEGQFPQQQKLQQELLRQQQQKQLQREEEFLRLQQKQRQLQLQQENILREQQQQLQQDRDRINILWDQQLQRKSCLPQQQHAEHVQTGNVVSSQPASAPLTNLPNSHQNPVRGQSEHFSPDNLPQSTQVLSASNGLNRSISRMVNPNRSTHCALRTARTQRTSINSAIIEEGDDQFQLSRSQVAARQAVSRDLPTFSGSPEEWPIFLSMFNSTTTMCGFTEEENLVRLQRSLKGKAYEAVKCRLMHPGNVGGIMDTLRMLYGQPEVIIHSLIGKISSLPAIREERLETLVDFAVSVQNFCATVESCGLDEYMYNVTLLHQLVSKLPPSIKLSWATHRKTQLTVNLATFSEWLYNLAEAASSVTFPTISLEVKPDRNDVHRTKKRDSYLNAHSELIAPQDVEPHPFSKMAIDSQSTPTKETCPVCKGNCKSVDKCKRFHEFSRDARWAVVREFGLCRTCLRQHKGSCKAKPCGRDGCTYRHHELLHNEQREINHAPSDNQQSAQPNASEFGHGCNIHRTTSNPVLFRYLPVVLSTPEKEVHTYAFLDEGSALTLLDQELADELELTGIPSSLCLRWTGGAQRHEKDSHIVKLHIAGSHRKDKKFHLEDVRTVNQLMLPPQTLDLDELVRSHPYLKKLPLESYHDARPRILIGMKHAQLGLTLKSREGKLGQPIAMKTRLGWTVCGGLGIGQTPNMFHYVFHVNSCNEETDEDLHQAMKDYFSLDSIGVVKPAKVLLSSEEERAQSLLQSRTHFNGERYETVLLWRYDDIRLPDNREMALRRHQLLEKRLEKDKQLAEVLQQKIADYVAKGYIRKLSSGEVKQECKWFLPVFPVTNPNKPGKVRIVWDAAAKAHGKSLNSALLKGPDLLSSLFAILLRFRLHPVAVTGDIREMFHQVLISEKDQRYQCFFWTDKDGNFVVYAMKVMTFGACCSPSSALYVKNINAKRFKDEYPEAYEAITKSHYVDDMLISVASEEDAIQTAKDVKYVHAQGGFVMQNWISNSRRVTSALQEVSTKERSLDLSSELSTEKVLGMWWNTTTDAFTYKVGWNRYGEALLKGKRRPTKREVLRVLMSIFDPLGLLAHFLAYLKFLLQDIWRSGISWDEEIDDDTFANWITWLKVLPDVENVQISRCYSTRYSFAEADEIQLHTFVDAGRNGMAAVCFIRFVKKGSIHCSLVTSKTRVAPLKLTSIPRLELQAAVIGTRLARTIIETLAMKVTKRFYWTDSRDVLCWLNSDHRRYTQFVGFKVTEILESTEAYEWHYVPSKLNVADDGTKRDKLPDLSSQSRWFNGPDFLWATEDKWPQPVTRNESTEAELVASLLVHCAFPDPVISVTDYSSWQRLRNVVARVLRFTANCRSKKQKELFATRLAGPLGERELCAAEVYLIRLAQQEGYPEEVSILQNLPQNSNTQITGLPKSSSLYKLTPWLDGHGILRMRTRIAACQYTTEDAKTPIILPRKHHITTLIISHYHNKYHHQNHETVINELRQKYQISRIRACFKQVRKDCQRCKIKNAVPNPPFMADLPPGRLAAYQRPFTHTGIDYFGPIEVVVGRRAEKRWGMLATCLTVRAIHIEVVHSLTTSSCIMAIRNFVARRGQPRKFYSDRGTNFIGADRVLKKLAEVIDQDKIMEEFVSSDTEWVFNPPLAPHMGGSWERLIRTVKSNLMAICIPRKSSDEVFRNTLTEIENVVNSRPLTHVPIDPDSAPALTPNHFLLGSSNGTKPLITSIDSRLCLNQNWCTSQILANLFWKRWVSDYLPEITRRTKWFQPVKPLTTGDIVVIVDHKLPRNCWPKGKVICATPGQDNQVRVATVRTMTGVYQRPVTQLAILDVQRVET
ncbi:uncharacterized protein LOC128735749 [Sabethes cyaneus]|uniref:uncharacterized protein LOC128735749 n=1 Tax=Sabethes cyaneus TaxID=53552 RepID=UPI00237EE920|nr:uncharacterized protein LOC128735749 [Sabethes cyaneus]